MIRVGQRLQQERTKKGITIEEVAKATKIRLSFLSAIEKGDYKKLPSMAYAHGFVKNYAEFLGVPTRDLMAIFRREFNEREYVKVLPEGFAKEEDFSILRFKFNQTMLLGITFILVLTGYVLFQYRYAILNPPLSIATPKENQTVTSPVLVAGETDPNATVYVNDMVASINRDGTFEKKVSLFPGIAIIRVRVTNRIGNETQVERKVVVESE